MNEKKLRILVVDDEERILILLRANLEAAGYEVLAAHDGRQALTILKRERVDAVITDMNMPEIGGLEEFEDDVFDVIADVSCFGEGSGVYDGEGYIEHTGERLGE